MSRARDLADRVLHNRTHEDTEGGRESNLTFKGEQSGGEISTLAQIQASHDGTSDDEKADLIFKTNDGSDGASPTERLRIDSAGATTFTVSDQGSAFAPNTSSTWNALEIFQDRGVTNSASGIAFRSQSGTAPSGIVSVAGNTTGGIESLAFMTSTGNTTSEIMRIDSSGNVGIGTDSPDGNLHVRSTIAEVYLQSDDGQLAQIVFGDASDSTRGRIYYDSSENMVFANNNLVERMRIDSSGNVGIGRTPQYRLHVEKSQANDFVSEIRNSSGTNPYGQVIRFSNASLDNNTQHFFYCTDVSAVRLVIDADGDVRNHDNSYGAISDERVKEQISDATSQWDDIKGLTVRKFKLKDDVRQYGDDAKFKLGLISQETELVSPNLIQEVAPDPNHILSSSEFGTLYEDGDDIPDGKEVGDVKERKTTVKGIRYSILYMKAVKALQEAMARIETLETENTAIKARLDALEAE